ncbi:Peroxisomal acyl-coenzyme A oxidase 1 [Camellia lanceoleosa]|uniref:Peroxisomal acyl-coenzyme A oxidase 1 n=1 Tax=Camellia lanceoleosa TaxID=1840588 RepID=A0ACC0I0T2_9ERIC|nr:Peroxisomal acyl-coenzyme A oxidase 1 [Camellia lanceoleosa]
MGGGAMATPPVGAMIGGGGVPSDHRTIQRPTTTNLHSHLPSSSSHLNQPLSSSTRFEPMDGRDDHKTTIRTHSSHYGSVFGSVPSDEVRKAMSDLQRNELFKNTLRKAAYAWKRIIEIHLSEEEAANYETWQAQTSKHNIRFPGSSTSNPFDSDLE